MLDRSRAFSGEYQFLSNFSYCKVMYGDVEYPSTEHAYQAAKTFDSQERQKVKNQPFKGLKALGRQLTIRPDWDFVKDDVMEALLRQKFAQEPFRTKLLATGNLELIEYNYWHDNYWGSCTCPRCGDKGQNKLGKLLMRIRKEIQNGSN